MTRQSAVTAIAMVTILAISTSARAGIFDDVVEGLRFSGFLIATNKDDMSNTATVVAANNFQGNTINFGDFDLTVAGPVTAMLTTGGREIPTLNLTLSTGLLNINPNGVVTVGPAQPLAYTFNFDSGTNTTNVTGNFLFDSRFSINTFGSYDLRFQFGNRQTTTLDGRFDGTTGQNFDFDIGPVDFEGNLFADLLATITDPFFEATGSENIFALFSGRTFRENQTASTVAAFRAMVEGGGILSDDDVATLAGLAMAADFLGDDVPDLGFLPQGLGQSGGSASAAGSSNPSIPEPTTLILLSLGAASAIRRRRAVVTPIAADSTR